MKCLYKNIECEHAGLLTYMGEPLFNEPKGLHKVTICYNDNIGRDKTKCMK